MIRIMIRIMIRVMIKIMTKVRGKLISIEEEITSIPVVPTPQSFR